MTTLGLVLIVLVAGMLVGAFLTLAIVYIVVLCADAQKRRRMKKLEKEIEQELEKDLVYSFK